MSDRRMLYRFAVVVAIFVAIGATTWLRTSALMDAARQGNRTLARMALLVGADPDRWTGRVPLHVAVERGHAGVALLLLEYGARPDLLDSSGVTPLWMASALGHEAIVASLLEKGADPAWVGVTDQPPLYVAAKAGHTGIVRLLLKHGAPVNRTGHGAPFSTALMAALDEEHPDTALELIAAGADPNQAERDIAMPRTVLEMAVEIDAANVVEALLERGARIDPAPVPGQAPLALRQAVDRDQEAIVALLVAHGARVDAATLFKVAEAGREAMLAALIDEQTDLQQVLEIDDDRYTVLHYAAAKGQTGAVRVLLDHGDPVDSRWTLPAGPGRHAAGAAFSGPTALSYAAAAGQLETMFLLIDRGADLNAASGLMAGRKALATTPLRAALQADQKEAVQLLLNRGAKVDDYTGWKDPGLTPLMLAAQYGRIDALKRMLEHKPRLDFKDRRGWTALALALYNGQSEAEHLLRNAGARIDAPGEYSAPLASPTAAPWSGQGFARDLSNFATGMKMIGYGLYGIGKAAQFLGSWLP